MKKFKIIFLVLSAALIIAALFFSCDLFNGNGHGTLVVRLPGESSRAAISPDQFEFELVYRVSCTGSGGTVTRDLRSGNVAPISLVAGDWSISVTVFNSADMEMPLNLPQQDQPQDATIWPQTVIIEAGKSATLPVKIGIRTDDARITRFVINNSYEGEINHADNYIIVRVPFGTSINNMNYSITHTGGQVFPNTTGTADFSNEQSFTVRSAGATASKMYTVTVEEQGPQSSGDFTFYETWEDIPWTNFGFTSNNLPNQPGIVDSDAETILQDIVSQYEGRPGFIEAHAIKFNDVSINMAGIPVQQRHFNFVASFLEAGYTPGPPGTNEFTNQNGNVLITTFNQSEGTLIAVILKMSTSPSPGFDPSSATATLITENNWANGNFPTFIGNGVHWYSFTATSARQYIHLHGGTLSGSLRGDQLPVYVELYDNNGVLQGAREYLGGVGSSGGQNAYGEDELAGTYLCKSWNLTVGNTYYIKVFPSAWQSNNYSQGAYRIAFNSFYIRPFFTVSPLTIGTWANGSITSGDIIGGQDYWYSVSGSEVWYSYTAATSGTHYLHFTGMSYSMDIYDSNGYRILRQPFGSSPEEWNGVLSGNTYYIRVRMYNYNSTTGTFQIAVSTSSNTPPLP